MFFRSPRADKNTASGFFGGNKARHPWWPVGEERREITKTDHSVKKNMHEKKKNSGVGEKSASVGASVGALGGFRGFRMMDFAESLDVLAGS